MPSSGSLGSSGPEVAWLQTALVAHGYLAAAEAEPELRQAFLGPRTLRALVAFQGRNQLEGSGVLDGPTLARLYEISGEVRLVTGVVRTTTGVPAGGLEATVWDVTSGDADGHRLGTAVSGPDGAYRIVFPEDAADTPGGQRRRLAVEVRLTRPDGTAVAASPVIVDPSAHENVDFAVAPDGDEHDQVMAALAGQADRLADLPADRLGVLATLTGVPGALLSQAATAARLAGRTAGDDPAVDPKLLYAALRAGMPEGLHPEQG
ncbi:peptidoglycan-binding domain-containing protein, partial [Frankia sp. CiP1_Cm_nod1]